MLDKLQLFLYVKKNVAGKVAQKAKMTNIFQLTAGRSFPLGTISKASFPFFCTVVTVIIFVGWRQIAIRMLVSFFD
jgi:hypothetical protein